MTTKVYAERYAAKVAEFEGRIADAEADARWIKFGGAMSTLAAVGGIVALVAMSLLPWNVFWVLWVLAGAFAVVGSACTIGCAADWDMERPDKAAAQAKRELTLYTLQHEPVAEDR